MPWNSFELKLTGAYALVDKIQGWSVYNDKTVESSDFGVDGRQTDDDENSIKGVKKVVTWADIVRTNMTQKHSKQIESKQS